MKQSDEKLIAILTQACEQEEKAANLYRLLAAQQKDEKKRELFSKLAAIEEDHSRQFSERLIAAGGTPPQKQKPTAMVVLMTRTLGTEAMLRRMEAEEDKNIVIFQSNAEALEQFPEERDLFHRIEKEEQMHSKTLQSLSGGLDPASRLEAMFKREKWHVSTGSWIGDAIYGVNDGLGAVFGIVSGVAGYSGGGHEVVVAGMFGMVASALSMGSGAFLAARSEREVYEAQIAREKQEIEDSPQHEIEELSLIYQLKGMNEEDSLRMARAISENKDMFLQTMAQEELGLSEKNFPNPITALVSSSLATSLGAIIPVIPFFFMHGMQAVIVSAIISTLAHFAVGAAKSIVTTRSWFSSGMEMTAVGLIEAVIAFGLGLMFGQHR